MARRRRRRIRSGNGIHRRSSSCATVCVKLLQILLKTRSIKLTYPWNSSSIRAPAHFAHILLLLIFICPFVPHAPPMLYFLNRVPRSTPILATGASCARRAEKNNRCCCCPIKGTCAAHNEAGEEVELTLGKSQPRAQERRTGTINLKAIFYRRSSCASFTAARPLSTSNESLSINNLVLLIHLIRGFLYSRIASLFLLLMV